MAEEAVRRGRESQRGTHPSAGCLPSCSFQKVQTVCGASRPRAHGAKRTCSMPQQVTKAA
eukprot:5099205-Pleurochrysis_carterae.AAC.2